MIDPLPYVTAGAVVGSIVGLTGVGGGSLMTPLLVLVFGQAPSVAVGTDLLFAASTKVAATGSFGTCRRVEWRVVGLLGLGSIPAALATAACLRWGWLPALTGERGLARTLAVVLAMTAIALGLHKPLYRALVERPRPWILALERWRALLMVVSGVVLGVLVTLTSVGAGALGTVALAGMYPWRLRGDRLIATDIAHAVPLTIISGLAHLMLGHVNFVILGWLLVGSVPAVLLSSRVTIALPPAVVRGALATMLLVTAGRLLSPV